MTPPRLRPGVALPCRASAAEGSKRKEHMKTTTTETERAALRRWYGAEMAPQMEALFASDTVEACREAAGLDGPGCAEFGASKRAARDAAWAIIHRARGAVAGGAR